jgi:hypothetical protein
MPKWLSTMFDLVRNLCATTMQTNIYQYVLCMDACACVCVYGFGADDSQVLPGDGYLDYVKPFRTIEDIHVSASILGLSMQMIQSQQWQATYAERTVAMMAALEALNRVWALGWLVGCVAQ